jgi:hypothetical protein
MAIPVTPASARAVPSAAALSGRRADGFARAVAIGAWLLIVALSIVELWLIAVTLDQPTPDQWGFRGFEAVMGLSFGSVGALIAMRRPENRVGWVLVVMGLISGLMGIVNQYPVLSDAARESLPFSGLARWVSAWIWVPAAAGLGSLLPLIFPDGHLPSPRWRAAVLLALVAVGTLVASIIVIVQPLGPLRPTPMVAIPSEHLTPFMAAGLALYLAALAAAAASLVRRYRSSRAEERQQIKWVAYATVFIALGAVPGMSPLLLGQVFFVSTAGFFALAIGIAVMRYRLYEIDLIINRTLVYGALSAVLAGVYTASITLSQRLFMAVTGEHSDAAIVLTTLIVAATFTPLKGRLQTIVDHRIKAATPISPAALATSSSLERLEALARLIEINASGGLTPEEFRSAKAELLQGGLTGP